MTQNAEISLSDEAAHYLRNVIRKTEGDSLRLFNGRDGEWQAVLSALSKKQAVVHIERQLRSQPLTPSKTQLIFALIKPARMDMLIEKAVELGATDFHPVLTQYTDIRKLNETRLYRQIIEAAEQCERLDVPSLHPLADLKSTVADWPFDFKITACLERTESGNLKDIIGTTTHHAFLVGPEGGFSAEEVDFLRHRENVVPVTFGPDILRAETAGIFAVAAKKLLNS